MTGNHLEDTPIIIEVRQKEIETFYFSNFSREEDELKPVTTKVTLLSDSEILELAKNAQNSDKFNKLMKGDFSDYPSQSEADLGLCNMLAFWCGNNPEQIDRIFRQSGLMRPKWKEQHGAKTYGEINISKAIESVTETYSREGDEVQEKEPHLTDLGNALRFARQYGGNVRFCHP